MEDQTQFFFKLKYALSDHFGAPATFHSLGNRHGSKTIQDAKRVGIFIARKAGYSNEEIASHFGIVGRKSVSRIFNNAIEAYYAKDHEFCPHADTVAAKLAITLD